jgi:selenocysteine-specific elongation factor
VICAGGALTPGTRAQARIALDHPVVARAGDRFVLRGGSPLTTIGGGIVNDPAPAGRRARPWPGSAATPRARLALILPAAGGHGVPESAIAVRTGATPAESEKLVSSLGGAAVRLDGVLYAPAVLEDLERRLVAAVDELQARDPLEPGAPLQSVRARLGAAAPLVDAALEARTRDGTLEVQGALVRRGGFRPTLDPAQARRREDLLAALRAAGREPPSVNELEVKLGPDAAVLLRMLEREQLVVAVESERYYAQEAVVELRNSLTATLSAGREYTPAELRDVLRISRKYLIPLLEYFDRTGFTRRAASGRMLSSQPSAERRAPRPAVS